MLPDAVEQAMDAAGLEAAHIVGNSLGGYVALQLASRGRAETVVALAPRLAAPRRLGRARGHRPLPQLDTPIETAQLILGFTSR